MKIVLVKKKMKAGALTLMTSDDEDDKEDIEPENKEDRIGK